MTQTTNEKLTVFYDGECPICTREIGFYKECDGGSDIDWRDVTKIADDEVHPGLSRDDALARFHVLTQDGRLMSGGPAFAQMWRNLKKFRLVGAVFSFPPIAWLLDRVYDLLLLVRPRLQKLFK